ncbi:HET-domain-containing protein [Hyaloscypha variabilis F]|uniref:HET-domain-containing protein n=1 Tax=Hyaloscypha variabilis (strain UAMH 11265 / GT02V1 / F) TaxID=1149755 RepID=A0A2J6S5D2_HYAVF|nr:HET-domain-containing protein [Hyaloscypha variabilis F]
MASTTNFLAAPSFDVYRPLAESEEIRLLELQPDHQHHGIIKCMLQHVMIPSSLPYEALSYMWGPQKYKTIELNGKPFQIRENLWQALSHFRLGAEPRTMWIDAICINQEDISERNHQVMQMGIIYSQASRTIVWLGLADSQTELAFQACKSHAENGLSHEAAYLHRNNLVLNFDDDELKAINSLCSREYWGRLWIIQEVLLAKHVQIYSGHLRLDWIYFQFVLDNIRQTKDSRMTLHQAYDIGRICSSVPQRLCSFRAGQSSSERRNLEAQGEGKEFLGLICANFGNSKCAEPKDRVFGFYGLAHDCCKNTITVDYSIPWFQICNAVFMHYIFAHSFQRPPGQILGLEIPLEKSQKFHRSLELRLLDYNLSPRETYDRDSWPRLISQEIMLNYDTHGTIRGEISHIFPLSITGSELSKTLLGSFSSLVLEQVERTKHFANKSQDGGHSESLTHDLDLVTSFPLPRCTAKWSHELGFPSQSELESSRGVLRSHLTLERLWQLLRIDVIVRTQPYYASTRWIAFQNDGTVCFVPSAARVGDFLVEFSNSDVVALVERNGVAAYKGAVVGRCVDFLPSDRKANIDTLDSFSLQTEITLGLNFRTLQLLTAASYNDCSRVFD